MQYHKNEAIAKIVDQCKFAKFPFQPFYCIPLHTRGDFFGESDPGIKPVLLYCKLVGVYRRVWLSPCSSLWLPSSASFPSSSPLSYSLLYRREWLSPCSSRWLPSSASFPSSSPLSYSLLYRRVSPSPCSSLWLPSSASCPSSSPLSSTSPSLSSWWVLKKN